MKWVWNPEHYGGIGATTVNKDRVWFPSVDVINHNNDAHNAKEDFYRVKLKHNGELKWLRQMRIKASCAVQISDYTFDTQLCEINIASRENSDNFM